MGWLAGEYGLKPSRSLGLEDVNYGENAFIAAACGRQDNSSALLFQGCQVGRVGRLCRVCRMCRVCRLCRVCWVCQWSLSRDGSLFQVCQMDEIVMGGEFEDRDVWADKSAVGRDKSAPTAISHLFCFRVDARVVVHSKRTSTGTIARLVLLHALTPTPHADSQCVY